MGPHHVVIRAIQMPNAGPSYSCGRPRSSEEMAPQQGFCRAPGVKNENYKELNRGNKKWRQEVRESTSDMPADLRRESGSEAPKTNEQSLSFSTDDDLIVVSGRQAMAAVI